MEAFMDWRLIYRTPEEVRALADGIAPADVAAIEQFCRREPPRHLHAGGEAMSAERRRARRRRRAAPKAPRAAGAGVTRGAATLDARRRRVRGRRLPVVLRAGAATAIVAPWWSVKVAGVASRASRWRCCSRWRTTPRTAAWRRHAG